MMWQLPLMPHFHAPQLGGNGSDFEVCVKSKQKKKHFDSLQLGGNGSDFEGYLSIQVFTFTLLNKEK